MSTVKAKEAKKAKLLPSALELAKLAAAIGFDDSGGTKSSASRINAAIHKAVRLYLRAMRFCKEHHSDSLAELAHAAGDTDLRTEIMLSKYAEKNPTLCLEMDKPNDQARRYLKKECGLPLMKARSVRENLKAFFRLRAIANFLTHKGMKPPKTEYMTEKEFDEEAERQAIAAGWNETDWKETGGKTEATYSSEGTRYAGQPDGKEIRAFGPWIQQFKEQRGDNREVYLLPASVLTHLAQWKKALKRSGGVKSRRTAAGKKTLGKSSQTS